MKFYRLVGKVVRVNGECSAGHHLGEEFNLTLCSEDGATQRAPRLCSFFYHSLFPYITTLQFGGSFPWEENENIFTAGCPDNRKVVIEIRRIKIR